MAEEHPFTKFQRSFHILLEERGWHKFTPDEEKQEVLALWRGSKKRYEIASLAACVGVMEHHWDLPPRGHYNNYKGKNYEKVRGHLGCHNKTLLAETKRLGLSGDPETWLGYWKIRPSNADFYGTSRLGFIVGIYGVEIGIRQWVTGEGWKTNRKDAKRSEKYARDVLRLQKKYFGGDRGYQQGQARRHRAGR